MTNGEKYKTAKDRAEAFCDGWMTEHPFRTVGNPVLSAFEWLDLEAPAEEPLPCPFCGGSCSVHILASGNPAVLCDDDDCFYHGMLANTKDAAIAAHNRVARAALAAASGESEAAK